MLKTAKKQMKKNGVIYLASIFPSRVMVLKLFIKVHFLQISDLSKTPESIEAIYIYTCESSHYTLSEKDTVYRGLSHHS